MSDRDVGSIEWPTPPPGLDFRVEGAPPQWLLRLAERIGWFKRHSMNADEARRISAENGEKPDAMEVSLRVRAIDHAINQAAHRGDQAISYPFDSRCTEATRQAIRKHYEAAGFIWADHLPSKFFDAQTEISW